MLKNNFITARLPKETTKQRLMRKINTWFKTHKDNFDDLHNQKRKVLNAAMLVLAGINEDKMDASSNNWKDLLGHFQITKDQNPRYKEGVISKDTSDICDILEKYIAQINRKMGQSLQNTEETSYQFNSNNLNK